MNDDYPSIGYRYFDKEEYADAALKGQFKISTLQACRDYEDLRKDQYEAIHTYKVSLATGGFNDPQFVRKANLLRIELGPDAENCIIHNVSRRTSISNAYLLCLSKNFKPSLQERFGKYCVKISDLSSFLFPLTESIGKKYETKVYAKLRYVLYGMRDYADNNIPSNNDEIGFIKPKFYADEEEIRFLINTKNQNIQPFILNYSVLGTFCERIS